MKTATKTYVENSRRQVRDDLIIDHLEYVRQILFKMRLPPNADMENLESAGVLGLIEAANQFDPEREVAFKTVSYVRIRGAILDELRRNSPLPQRMLQRVAKVRDAYGKLDPPVELTDIAELTELTLEEVEECLEAIRLIRPEPWNDLVSTVQAGAQEADQPSAIVEENERKDLMVECIEALPERDRILISMYYMEDMRLIEIGEVLGIVESSVSRALSKAEFRLKEMIRQRGG